MQVTKPHVNKGDTVMVIAVRKSKTGKILLLLASKNGVIVEGLNLVKRHVKAKVMNLVKLRRRKYDLHSTLCHFAQSAPNL